MVKAVEDGGIFLAHSASCGKAEVMILAVEDGGIQICRRFHRLIIGLNTFPQLALRATNMCAVFDG
jgi:hypothetical protein